MYYRTTGTVWRTTGRGRTNVGEHELERGLRGGRALLIRDTGGERGVQAEQRGHVLRMRHDLLHSRHWKHRRAAVLHANRLLLLRGCHPRQP